MQDFRDSNNRAWCYLGYAFVDDAATNQLNIITDVRFFRRFVMSCSTLARHHIFNGATLRGVWQLTPHLVDNHPNARNSDVLLSFRYTYDLTLQDGRRFQITNRNAALHGNVNDFDFMRLRTRTPSAATVTLTPYAMSLGPHHPAVDLYVYYRWPNTHHPVTVGQVLVLLRMDQEPIPVIPAYAPPPSDDQWRLVGDPVRVTELLKELKLYDGIAGFLESFPVGEIIRDKFVKGYGIRAANVYAGNNEYPGMQLKLKRVVVPNYYVRYYVSIALGSLLEYENQFIGDREMIEVCYRWRSSALELLFRIVP